jgi:tripartite-type tricarboxylate transporter receptor subunit TctC
MILKKLLLSAIFVSITSTAISATADYKIILPLAVGLSADAITRKIADTVERNTGRTMIVQNMPGANGVIGTTNWKNEKNPYILSYASGAIVYEPLINSKLQYDDRDFNFIIHITTQPGVWVTRPDTKIKTPADLLNHMPDQVGGYALSWNQNPLVFAKEKNLNIEIIPYKGLNEAIQGLLSKETDLIVGGNSSTIMSLVKAGKLHIVGTTSNNDFVLDGITFLSVPQRTGVPSFGSAIGLALKPNINVDQAAFLKRELWRAVQDPEVQSMIISLGYMNDSTNNEQQIKQSIINQRNRLKKYPITKE